MQPVTTFAQETHTHVHDAPVLQDQLSDIEGPQFSESDDDTEHPEQPSWIKKHALKIAGTTALAGILYGCYRFTHPTYHDKTDPELDDIYDGAYEAPPEIKSESVPTSFTGTGDTHDIHDLRRTLEGGSSTQSEPSTSDNKTLRHDRKSQASVPQDPSDDEEADEEENDDNKSRELPDVTPLKARVRPLSTQQVQPGIYMRELLKQYPLDSTYNYNVIKTLMDNKEVPLKNKELIIKQLLKDDLKRLGVDIKDSKIEQLSIDGQDNDGNTVFASLCHDSTLDTEKIKFMLQFAPNPLIANKNGLCAASALLERKELKETPELKYCIEKAILRQNCSYSGDQNRYSYHVLKTVIDSTLTLKHKELVLRNLLHNELTAFDRWDLSFDKLHIDGTDCYKNTIFTSLCNDVNLDMEKINLVRKFFPDALISNNHGVSAAHALVEKQELQTAPELKYCVEKGILRKYSLRRGYDQNTYNYNVIKDLIDSDMKLEHKQLILQNLLAHDLKTFDIDTKDPEFKQLQIDGVDCYGNTVFTSLCRDSKLNAEKIRFMIQFLPDPGISNENGACVASELLERKDLAKIKELNSYVELDCSRRLGTSYEEYIPLPTDVRGIIREYADSVAPSVLYYARAIDEKNYSQMIKKYINCQDSYGRTLLHLMVQNMKRARKNAGEIVDSESTPDNHKRMMLYQKVSQQNAADLAYLYAQDLDKDKITDQHTLALLDVIEQYHPNLWMQSHGTRHAFDLIDTHNTANTIFAYHILASEMIKQFIAIKFPQDLACDTNKQLTPFQYAHKLYSKCSTQPLKIIRKNQLLLYAQQMHTINPIHYSITFGQDILGANLDPELLAEIHAQDPIDFNAQDQDDGETCMHTTYVNLKALQKHPDSVQRLRNIIHDYKINLRTKNKLGRTIIRDWEASLEESKRYYAGYERFTQLSAQEQQAVEATWKFEQDCINMFQEVVKI